MAACLLIAAMWNWAVRSSLSMCTALAKWPTSTDPVPRWCWRSPKAFSMIPSTITIKPRCWLPAVDAGIWRAVGAVDAVSTKECAFHCIDCLIPSLRDVINDTLEDDGLEEVNDFARQLAKQERIWGEAEFVRYKALLAAVGQPDLTSAAQLLEKAEQYELLPEVAQTWGYAELALREKYPDLPEELFQTPQAAQIGQRMLDDRLGAITDYGLIRRKDGQPLPVFQPEQEIGQGLEMM